MSSNRKQNRLEAKFGVPNSGSRTDVGRVRDHNEDSLVVKHPLYAVFDGMGGHAAGEVASEIAANVLQTLSPSILDPTALGQAVVNANLEIIHAAQIGQGRQGMGTTCTAALLNGNRLVLAQVGDSRAYLLHEGNLQQLTRDHSYVADLVERGEITKDYARIHPDRSKITRALGTDPNMVPDLYELTVEEGDRLLLCSDGLYSMITDDDIEHILNSEEDPQAAADRLVSEANGWGGHDNITVIVVDAKGFAEIKKKKLARKTKVTATFIVLVLLAVIGGSAWVLNNWISNSAYLAECDGKVAIYHGIPSGNVGGRTDNLAEVSDVSISDLDSSVAQRVRAGEVRYNSYDEAKELVNSYKENIAEKKQEEAKKKSPTNNNGNNSSDNSANNTSGNGGNNSSSSGNSSTSSAQSGQSGTNNSTTQSGGTN